MLKILNGLFVRTFYKKINEEILVASTRQNWTIHWENMSFNQK